MFDLFAPAGRLLARLRFAGKFTLVGILFLLPLLLVFYYFQSEINTNIAFVELERVGVAYERPTTQLLEDILQHQRLVSRLSTSHDVSPEEITRQGDQVDQDIQAIDVLDVQSGAALKSTNDWTKVKASWQTLKSAPLSDGKTEDAYQPVVDGLVAFVQAVGNNSNLILDPQLDSYYTMDSALTQTPQILVNLSRAGDMAAGAAHRRTLTPNDRTQLTVLTGQISTPLATLQGDVQQAEQFNPAVKGAIEALQSVAVQKTNASLNLLQSGLLQPTQPRVSDQAVQTTTAEAAEALAQYRTTALSTLDGLLQTRLHHFLVRRAAVDAGVAGSILLALYIFIALTRFTTRTLAELSQRLTTLNTSCISNLGRAIQALEHGDLTAQIETGTLPLVLETRDELGEVGATFNVMLAQTVGTINSFRTSQDALSTLVRQLQTAAAHVGNASHSLSATTMQTEAASGEIAHSIREIASASGQAALGADEVAKGSSLQAASVSQGASLLNQLTQAVQTVALDAENATQATGSAMQAAAAGTVAVEQSLTGMANIQRTVCESAQVIGQLGQSSAKIGSIVSTIEEIAEQTNLLALNAAIEAARVGEAGRGFSVVADEVRKLAERSSRATAEIQTLVGEVQTRTAVAVAAMDGGVREVEVGSALAQQAKDALTDIRQAVSAVNESVSGILTATGEMTDTTAAVSHQITDVAAVVEEASAAAEEMSASAGEVAVAVGTVASASAQQKASITQLVLTAQELTAVARDLEGTASRFQVAPLLSTEAGTAAPLRRAA